MKLDDLSSILLFVFFFLPGFVSLKVWSLFFRQKKADGKSLTYDCIFFSIVNFGLLSPVSLPFFISGWYKDHPVLTGFFVLFYCVVAPTLWPILWKFLINKKFMYRFIQLPYPTAWDYFVGQRKSCFMLVHLNDDSMIGGHYGENSYASTWPDPPSIYLEKVFKVKPDGTFGEEIADSFGLVLSKEDYKYIEFFYEK